MIDNVLYEKHFIAEDFSFCWNDRHLQKKCGGWKDGGGFFRWSKQAEALIEPSLLLLFHPSVHRHSD
jgi:hypothetical protein